MTSTYPLVSVLHMLMSNMCKSKKRNNKNLLLGNVAAEVTRVYEAVRALGVLKAQL